MLRKLPLLLVTLALIPVWAGCGDSLPPDAAAKVDDRVITKDKVKKAVENMIKQYGPLKGSQIEEEKKVVQKLIMEEVAQLEAEKRDITVTEAEIDDQVEKQKQQFGGEEKLNARLAETGITTEEFRDNLRRWIVSRKLFEQVTREIPPPSEEEALKFYNENPNLFEGKSFEEVKSGIMTQLVEMSGGREAYFYQWLNRVMLEHVIIYAEEYKPAAEAQTATTTATVPPAPAGTPAP